MLKLDYDEKVLTTLMAGFPKYSQATATKHLNKYLTVLQRLLRNAKINNPAQRSAKKCNTYTIYASDLSNKTCQLGSDKIRIHKWLKDNNVALVYNINPNYGPKHKMLAEVSRTKYLKITNESILDQLREMTSQQREIFLNDPTADVILDVNNYLEEYKALSSVEQHVLYDVVGVDIDSVKNYLKNLADGKVLIPEDKQESDANYAEFILRIAQLNNNQLPQLKERSDFGRTYYKNLSVQNVSKEVRKAFLGDSWEYDCKSCSAAWKMSFARTLYDFQNNHQYSFEEMFCGLVYYLTYKADFFDKVIKSTFDDKYPYSYEYKTKIIKQAMTAIGFGAKLTTGSWRTSYGEIKSSSLLKLFENDKELLYRFVNCEIVRAYNEDQAKLNKFIVEYFSSDATWMAEMETSRIKRKVKAYTNKQKISWLFQHAETLMMDIVRSELQKLGKTLLANVHDAIVIREQLTLEEIQVIEQVVKVATGVTYFALGETQYERCT